MTDKVKIFDTTLRDGGQTRKARVAGALEDFVSEAKKHRIKKIVLYGSTARGDDREDSDVDLLIVGDRRDWDKLAGIEVELDLKYGVPIVSTIHEKENESPFVRSIMDEGRVLYER
jgi:uncharacterized protein